MMLRVSVVGLVVGLMSAMALASETGRIEVHVESLRSDAGQVFVSLFNREEGFPGGEEPPFRTLVAKPLKGQVTVVFEDIPYGEYAVAAHHDEDGDGKMKTVYGTIPLEGIGISRDAKGMMGPPRFKDAKVDLNSVALGIVIHVNY